MRLRFLLPIVLVAVCAVGVVGSARPSAGLPDKVLVLMGDEQMLGRGFPLAAGETSDPQVQVWRGSYLGWQAAADPLGSPSDLANGVGPGLSLGKRVAAQVGSGTVGLVMCGKPQTSMANWERDSDAYKRCIKSIRSAGGQVVGAFLVEGARDATDKDRAQSWRKRFAKTAAFFRRDVDLDTPVVVAEVGNIVGKKLKYVDAVRASQDQATLTPNVAVVPTGDLAIDANGLDYTVDSYKTLGSRMADAWWQLEQPISSLSSPDEVFVLVGQSNMVGRGQPLSEGSNPNPNLWNWRGGFWREATDPLASPMDSESGIGPGMTFGLALAGAEPGRTIGLVMCAKGNTSMTQWTAPKGASYNRCLSQVAGTGAVVTGILFLQGESDAASSSLASEWAANFAAMVAGFRAALGVPVPVVIGEIGQLHGSEFKYQGRVRAQQELAATQNTNTAIFSTLDLPLSPDGVHFTVSSYQVIGVRFANTWQTLTAP